MPLSELRLNQTNRPVEVVDCWRDDGGGILLSPPYQRGDVWGTIRRRNFIRSLLMGVPIPSIVINDRMNAEGWGDDFRIAVIDGKQRITTIFMFLDDNLSIPAEWFHENHIQNRDNGMVRYSDLNRVGQRKFKVDRFRLRNRASNRWSRNRRSLNSSTLGAFPRARAIWSDAVTVQDSVNPLVQLARVVNRRSKHEGVRGAMCGTFKNSEGTE